MTHPDDIIAPSEAQADTTEFLRGMFLGVYPAGTVLGYRSLRLICESAHAPRVWDIVTAEGDTVEVLNLEAFRTALELEETLDEIRRRAEIRTLKEFTAAE